MLARLQALLLALTVIRTVACTRLCIRTHAYAIYAITLTRGTLERTLSRKKV